MRLFHYTCGHGFNGIVRLGVIRPNRPLWGDFPPLVWLTDMREPDRDALGLTSRSLPCDRLEFRFIVKVADPIPWTPFADAADFHDEWRDALESFGSPNRWWVSLEPIPASAWRVDDAWRHRGAA